MISMIVNINRLTESLDRKLQESASLNEKFNASFPDWLKRRIIVTKDSSNYQKAKNIPYSERPNYINARDDKYDSYESNESMKNEIIFLFCWLKFRMYIFWNTDVQVV